MRGLAISLMIIVNFLATYSCTPAGLRHAAPLHGLAFADLGAPFFYFMIGIGYRISFCRRAAREGLGRAQLHLVKRYFLLLAFGFAGALVTRMHVICAWNVLQAIGWAGLLALPFIGLAPLPRALAALGILAAWQVIGLLGYNEWLMRYDTGGLGGVLGGLAWCALVLLASLLADALGERPDRRYFTWLLGFAAAGIGAGLLLGLALPISKPLVTAPYILLCTGLAAVTLALLTVLADLWHRPVPLLSAVGRNALLLFMLHGVLSLLVGMVVPPDAAPLVVAASALGIFGACLALAVTLQRRGLYWTV